MDGGLSRVAIVAIFVLGSDDVEEDLVILAFGRLRDGVIVVSHQLELGLGARDLTSLHDATKGVAHDGDQHVEHGKLRDERRHNEEDVAESSLWVVSVVVKVELSERKEVLIDQHVDAPEAEDWVDHLIAFVSVHVEHVERDAEREQGANKQDHECLDVLESLTDKQDVEGCAFKQPQPVEKLDEDAQTDNRCKDAQELVRDYGIIILDSAHNDEHVATQANEINPIPDFLEVIKFIIHLKELDSFVVELEEPLDEDG